MKQMKQDDLIQFFIYHYKLINIVQFRKDESMISRQGTKADYHCLVTWTADNEEWYNDYYNDLAVVPLGVFQVIIIPNISSIIPVRVLTKVDFNILYPLRCKLEYFYYLCTLKGII